MPLQVGVSLLAIALLGLQAAAEIPRTWASSEVADFELPLADPAYSPEHVPEEYYYRLPVRPIYKSYPIYHPDHEPAGYRAWLARQAPEVVFGASDQLEQEDWVAAGDLVFAAPIGYNGPVGARHVSDRAWYAEVGVPITADGIMPYARWVVRAAGLPEVGNLACAMCHTRVMPDGTVVDGAQGNFPFDRSLARDMAGTSVQSIRAGLRQLTFAPWVADDPVLSLPRGPAAGDAGGRAGRGRNPAWDERRLSGPRTRSHRNPRAALSGRHRAGAPPLRRRPDALRRREPDHRHAGPVWRLHAGRYP